MLSLKHELLAALAAELDKLLPGAAAKAAFESPKVASHGDFASTAAMQLAKPLGKNPRQVAETLREALLKTESFTRWVESIDIAGPGFLNIRLKPEAKQQVIREVLSAATHFGDQASLGKKMMVEFVSANPTGPLHVGHGRQAALGGHDLQFVPNPRLGRLPRVLLQRRGCANRHADQQHPAAWQRLQTG